MAAVKGAFFPISEVAGKYVLLNPNLVPPVFSPSIGGGGGLSIGTASSSASSIAAVDMLSGAPKLEYVDISFLVLRPA